MSSDATAPADADATENDALRTGNLLEAAELLRVSRVTMGDLMRKHADDSDDPLPVKERGTNGRSYVFDLDALAQWYKRHNEAIEAANTARSEQLTQLRLDYFGETASDENVGLSAAEREAEVRAELAAVNLGKIRRELVKASDVEAVLAEALSGLQKEITALPETMVRDAGLDRQLVTPMREIVDAALRRCADKLRALAPSDQDRAEAA